MKKLLSLFMLLVATSAFANPIDDSCKQLTYKSAPIVKADQYICHKEYAVAYSWTSRNPIYTTEFLAANHTGKVKRSNDFRVDPAVDAAHRSSPKDYVHSTCNGGRCDRGHMTPDQDFSACNVCVHESFFMSNMVPQNYKNNEVIWKQLETYIRDYTKSHPAGVYVITGPVYHTSDPATIGKDKVWVPDFLWKIMIDAQTGKSIAFLMPNAPEHDLSKFVVNLATIEAQTGIKFDASLDKTTVANYQTWLTQAKQKRK